MQPLAQTVLRGSFRTSVPRSVSRVQLARPRVREKTSVPSAMSASSLLPVLLNVQHVPLESTLLRRAAQAAGRADRATTQLPRHGTAQRVV